jgi:hypothetical protein
MIDSESKYKDKMDKPVVTLDKFLSIWIFIYTIAYLIGIVPYNPIILISIALTYFLISLFIIIPQLNDRSLLTYYIIINTLGKIIPLSLIINKKINNSDIIFTIYFIIAYIVYMYIVNENIIYVYREYIMFIIDRDKAREGAIYHEIDKIFKGVF